jgi:hypothetical protein
MPRFVLLYHICPPGYERPSHWDLMLEVGDTLHTWALRKLPCDWRAAQRKTVAIDPACPPVADNFVVDAEQLGHHRLAYLEYEGPVSGNRGRVHRVDSGTFIGGPKSPKEWRLQLNGQDLRGDIALQSDDAECKSWTLTCKTPG